MAVNSDVSLIYSDMPGPLPAAYEFVSDIDIQSVVARIDGTAAAGSFLPTLSVYSQDGKLMGRVPSDVTYAVGDTGVVTWSPFLARRIAAVSGGYPFTLDSAGLQNPGAVVVPDSTWTALTGWASAFTTGSAAFIKTAGGPNRIQYIGKSAILISGIVEWVAPFAGERRIRFGPNGFLDPATDNFADIPLGNSGAVGAYTFAPQVSASAGFFDITIEVWQASGVAQTLTGDCTVDVCLVGKL